jgi:hypothetical protein
MVVVVASLALVAYLKPVITVKELAHRGVDAGLFLVTNAPTIAERFKTGTISHTFREGIPEVHSTHGDVLEVAVSRSDETFTRTDSRWIAWDWLYLGTTVAEIRVPVTYRYHVRLSDHWRLAARDQVCIVLAPPIRPSLPPAIHIDEMEKRAESGWARFDAEHQLKALEKSMISTLGERAGDDAHMNLVRAAARQSVATFVRNWLMREDHWRTDRFTSIVVVFPDEVSPASDEELARENYEPTIRLESEKGK